ncbi:hexokinase-domain-containing protein [Endogone sp. FLAS-F59071]|nr:hexokinase-domain-containing protein [Endogone sp. FLAS-F59071]|eukprot:RUS12882.1 hexokinase-domain-containing protein [Endogone sp. FLAS-F59071]
MPSTATHDDAISQLQREFEIPKSSLRTILDSFLGEFDKGLQSHGQVVSTIRILEQIHWHVPMIPTYVYHLPTGHETGIYLAIDLGGTNLRVCRVDLLGNRKFTMRQQKYLISNELKHAHATDLFDYIANCLKIFIDTECIDGHPHGQGGWKIGQLHINHGKLLRWTKGFNCHEAVGQNMAQLLQEALDRILFKLFKSIFLQKTNATVVAITNDTTGTLVATNYTDSNAHVGLILGTGTNAAYVEKLEAMSKCLAEVEADTVKRRLKDEGAGAQMVVNTEWGAFGGNNPVY